MRRVIVSSLVLALCLGFAFDASAKKEKKRSSRSSKRSSKVKASSSSTSSASSDSLRASRTTSSSSSSSSSTTDITSSTHRFIADSMTYETKLKYDTKYDLGEMFLPSVLTYYKTNGSEGINEKLCFGPYMTLTGISTAGEIMTKTAEAGFECEPLLATYSYTLELKEASKDALSKFAYPRRVKIVRSDIDVAYMQFNYENYVDVSDYVPKIVKAVADAKSACSSVYDDMEKLKRDLGWSTGFSAGGMALSAGATGVGVLNVMKTNEVNRNLSKRNELKNVVREDISEDLYKDEKCPKEKKIEVSSEPMTSVNIMSLACLRDARTKLQEKIIAEEKNLGFDPEKVEKEINKVNTEFNKFVFEMYDDGNLKWNDKGDKIVSCKICKFDENYNCQNSEIINNNAGRCNSLVASYGLPYASKTEFEKAREEKYKTLSKKANEEQVRIWNSAEGNSNFRKENNNYNVYTSNLTAVNNRISELENAKNAAEENKKLEKNVISSVKTSHTLDWVQVGLNAGAFATSGGSLIFSIHAVNTAAKAAENLRDCESKINTLKLRYNEYKAEVESYGEEE